MYSKNKFHPATLVFWQWWIESGVLRTLQDSNIFFHPALSPSSLEARGFKPAPIPCVELVGNLLLPKGVGWDWFGMSCCRTAFPLGATLIWGCVCLLSMVGKMEQYNGDMKSSFLKKWNMLPDPPLCRLDTHYTIHTNNTLHYIQSDIHSCYSEFNFNVDNVYKFLLRKTWSGLWFRWAD